MSTHIFACVFSSAGISLTGTVGTVLTLAALYSAVPGLNCLGYVKIFTLTMSLITQLEQRQSALNTSTCQLRQETLFVNVPVVFNVPTGRNATVTQGFACIVPTPATMKHWL